MWTTTYHRLPIAGLLAALLAALLACAAATAAAQPPAKRQPAKRQLFDGVRGIIGDRVILHSTLEQEARIRLGSETDISKQRAAREALIREIQYEETLIDYGRSITQQQGPGESEEWIDEVVESRLRDEIRRSGGLLQRDQELGTLGTTWAEIRRRERDRIFESVARQKLFEPLSHNQGLMVTPRAIREY